MKKENQKKVVIIGAGVAGLSSAANLAYKGYDVEVIEKFDVPGGRNRMYTAVVPSENLRNEKERKYLFEMGPSWLWMPDIHDDFYQRLGKNRRDYLKLRKLEPAYKIIFENCEVSIPNGKDDFEDMLCSIVDTDLDNVETATMFKEKIREDFTNFFEMNKLRYDLSIENFLDKPALSPTNFIGSMSWESRKKLFKALPRIGLTQSQRSKVNSMFKPFNASADPKIQEVLRKIKMILEWPVIFVGGSPEMIPEVYGLLSASAIGEGTFIPENGMYDITLGMYQACKDLGVKFNFETEAFGVQFNENKSRLKGVLCRETNNSGSEENLKLFNCDEVIATCDMKWFEEFCLPEDKRMYTPKYWEKTLVSPCCLLFFVGLKTTIRNPDHHVLFFDGPLYKHMDLIYEEETSSNLERKFKDMKSPLFYVNIASKSQQDYAPDGCESLFILIPMPHREFDSAFKEWMFKNVMQRIGDRLGFVNTTGKKAATLIDFVEVRNDYSYDNFISDYNSLKGNAFGISNTLLQTAFFRPRMQSLHVSNLSFAGQCTVPGGGVPPCILSGNVIANVIEAKHKKIQPNGFFDKMTRYTVDTLERLSSVGTVWMMHYINPYFKF